MYSFTMIEFDSITTRGGDRGQSSLYNGERRKKDDPIFEALGDLDELNSWLGLIKTGLTGADRGFIDTLQGLIITASGEVAAPRISEIYKKITHLDDNAVIQVETEQKRIMSEVNIPGEFIHPGETRLGAEIDIARTVSRRCERRIVHLIMKSGLSHLNIIQQFLNRISDYLYVLARKADAGRL